MKRIFFALTIFVVFIWGVAAGRYDVFPGPWLKSMQDRISPDPPAPDSAGTLLDGATDNWLTTPADIVMVGDSITARGRWNELFPGPMIANRGIGGDTVTGVQKRLAAIRAPKPKKLFLMIGVNDIIIGRSADETIVRYDHLLTQLRGPKIYVQSIFLCGPIFCDDAKRAEAAKLNAALLGLAAKHGATFIDIAPHFTRDGVMRDDLAIDGLHLNGEGYRLWRDLLKPYVEQPKRKTRPLPPEFIVPWEAIGGDAPSGAAGNMPAAQFFPIQGTGAAAFPAHGPA